MRRVFRKATCHDHGTSMAGKALLSTSRCSTDGGRAVQVYDCPTATSMHAGDFARFSRFYGAYGSSVDVSPLKRPWLEGSLTVSLVDAVRVTVASNVHGMVANAVVQEVQHQALVVADSIERAARADGTDMSPVSFLRFHLRTQHAMLLEVCSELDLSLRFSLTQMDDSNVHSLESGAAHVSAGSSAFRCSVYLTDPWTVSGSETLLRDGCGVGADVVSALDATCASLAEYVVTLRQGFVEEYMRELELCVSEVAFASSSCNTARLSGVQFVSYKGGGEAMAVQCHVHSVTARVVPLAAEEIPVIRVCRPIVPISTLNSIVYAEHDTFPRVVLETLQSMEESGQLEASSGSGTVSPAALLRVSDCVQDAHPSILSAVAQASSGPLSPAPPAVSYVHWIGRQQLSTFLSAKLTRDVQGNVSNFPSLVPEAHGATVIGPEAESPIARLARHLEHELGSAALPLVQLLRLRRAPASRATADPAFSISAALALSDDTGAVLACGRSFSTTQEAILSLMPGGVIEESAASAAKSATPLTDPAKGTLSTPTFNAARHDEASGAAAVESLAETGNVVGVVVDVLDVEQTLRNCGVVQCTLDAQSKQLFCYDNSGKALFHFNNIDSYIGLSRFCRFVSRRKHCVVFTPVTVMPSTKPLRTAVRLLRAMMRSSNSSKLMIPPSYVRGLRVEMPLCAAYVRIRHNNFLELDHLVRQLLALVQHHCRQPSQWPLATFPPCSFFEHLPLTKTALAALRGAWPGFTYHFNEIPSSTLAHSAASSGATTTVSVGHERQPFAESHSAFEVVFSATDRRMDIANAEYASSGCDMQEVYRCVLPPGARFVQEFHAALVRATGVLNKRLEEEVDDCNAVSVGAVDSPSDGALESSKGGITTKTPEQGVSCPPWESLTTYAIPGIITASHAKSAHRAVLEHCFKGIVVFLTDSCDSPSKLLLPVTPTFSVPLASCSPKAVGQELSLKAQLCETAIKDSLQVLSVPAGIIREIGELLGRLSNALSATGRRRGERTNIRCILRDSVGDSGSTVADILITGFSAEQDERDTNTSADQSQHRLVSSNGANRLEALVCILPQLRSLVRTHESLAPATTPAVVATTTTVPRSSRSTVEAAAAHSIRTEGLLQQTHKDLCLAVAKRHMLESVFFCFEDILGRLYLRGERSAGGGTIDVAYLPCTWQEVPRLSKFLLLQSSAYRGPLPLVVGTAVHLEQVLAQAEVVEVMRPHLPSQGVSALSVAIHHHLPQVQDIHARMVLRELGQIGSPGKGRSQAWIASLSLDADTLGVERNCSSQMEARKSSSSNNGGSFMIACQRGTKLQAARACLASLYCWLVAGVPVRLNPLVNEAAAMPVIKRARRPMPVFTLPDGGTMVTGTADCSVPQPEDSRLNGPADNSAVKTGATPRPRRVAKRVKLRDDLSTNTNDTPAPSSNGPVGKPVLPTSPSTEVQIKVPSASHSNALLDDLLSTASLALTQVSGTQGDVRVMLSGLFGIQFMFHPRTSQTPHSSIKGPTVDQAAVELLREPWAALSSDGAVVALEVLRCAALVATRALMSEGKDPKKVIHAFLSSRSASLPAVDTPLALCTTLFTSCCGWEVVELPRSVQSCDRRAGSVYGSGRGEAAGLYVEITVSSSKSTARRPHRRRAPRVLYSGEAKGSPHALRNGDYTATLSLRERPREGQTGASQRLRSLASSELVRPQQPTGRVKWYGNPSLRI